MKNENHKNFIRILEHELIPALGCTEPIAIAYAAAKARSVLGCMPEHIEIQCSGNIIKNVKGVTVPNSGGLVGIEAAAILGTLCGNADTELEVLGNVKAEDIELCKTLVGKKMCSTTLVKDVDNLYIVAVLTGEGHRASVAVVNRHTLITRIEKDGEIIFTNDTYSNVSQSSLNTTSNTINTSVVKKHNQDTISKEFEEEQQQQEEKLEEE